MPELPEVETIVRGLKPYLEGTEMGTFRLLFPPLLRRASGVALAVFEGKKVTTVKRRGKMILVECEGGRALIFHLKMTGQMLLERPDVPVDKHVRLIIPLVGRDRELRFRDIRKFGFLCCFEPSGLSPVPELDALGPEPLEIDFRSFARLFQGRRGRIKSFLLDQGVLAGIGNIYADEILFRAQIHPLTPASSLGERELKALWKSIRATLKLAISRKGSSIRDYTDPNGDPGDFQKLHKVYGREGGKCPRCKTTVGRIKVSGRSTFFCPGCQQKSHLA
jgi:formamidopyrimidine-DNA glycosylase